MDTDKVPARKLNTVSKTCVVNKANQPREFKILGVWYKWEPAGQEGDTVVMESVIISSEDFKRVSKYFALKETTNA